MDAAVATSCQLEAFRRRFSVAAPERTVWMSATLEPSWLGHIAARSSEPRQVPCPARRPRVTWIGLYE